MEEKGLNEALNVLENYLQMLANALLDTVLLPFRLVDGLLQ